MSNLIVAPDLTVHDTIVLQNLIDDIERYNDKHLAPTDGDEGYASQESLGEKSKDDERELAFSFPFLPAQISLTLTFTFTLILILTHLHVPTYFLSISIDPES